MVYCTKCGTQNPDDALVCSNCGAPLKPVAGDSGEWRHMHGYNGRWNRGDRPRIGGILFGLFVILIGLAVLAGWNVWNLIWPIFLILLGLAIIFGSSMRRRWM